MEIKRNFVKVVLGSRGECEEVELVETSYSLISKEFSETYESLKEDCEDVDDLSYLEEFSNINIDLDKGEVVFSYSDEDCTFYIEVEKNKDLCNGLLEGFEDLDNEFYELIGNLGC